VVFVVELAVHRNKIFGTRNVSGLNTSNQVLIQSCLTCEKLCISEVWDFYRFCECYTWTDKVVLGVF